MYHIFRTGHKNYHYCVAHCDEQDNWYWTRWCSNDRYKGCSHPIVPTPYVIRRIFRRALLGATKDSVIPVVAIDSNEDLDQLIKDNVQYFI